jgi:hypothetical protein
LRHPESPFRSGDNPIDIGVFIPINNGSIISAASPQSIPSFELNKQVVSKAEAYGFDFAFSMIKLSGFGGKTEFWDPGQAAYDDASSGCRHGLTSAGGRSLESRRLLAAKRCMERPGPESRMPPWLQWHPSCELNWAIRSRAEIRHGPA